MLESIHWPLSWLGLAKGPDKQPAAVFERRLHRGAHAGHYNRTTH